MTYLSITYETGPSLPSAITKSLGRTQHARKGQSNRSSPHGSTLATRPIVPRRVEAAAAEQGYEGELSALTLASCSAGEEGGDGEAGCANRGAREAGPSRPLLLGSSLGKKRSRVGGEKYARSRKRGRSHRTARVGRSPHVAFLDGRGGPTPAPHDRVGKMGKLWVPKKLLGRDQGFISRPVTGNRRAPVPVYRTGLTGYRSEPVEFKSKFK
jgi:hypothetical protein